MKHTQIVRLVLTALFLALGLVLPFLTGQIPEIGGMLLPMHIPAILCGFLCGWPYGLAVGFVTPLLRSVLFGMPPMIPTALAMAFELATYGAVCGVLYAKLQKTTFNLYLSLIAAMLAGRLVWGLVSLVIYSAMTQNAFTLAAFIGGAFLKAWPGVALQLVLIPLLMLALQKAKVIPVEGAKA